MKNNMTTIEYVEKLNEMEKEITKMKKSSVKPKIAISLYGILKGAKFSLQDVHAAKKSLFKKVSP
jgi:hypothetical protein